MVKIRKTAYNLTRKVLFSDVLAGYTNGEEKNRSVLFISPTPHWGSLGDEAMLIGSCEYLQEKGYKVGVCVGSKKNLPEFLDLFDRIEYVPGLYSQSVKSAVKFFHVMGRWEALGVFGADVIEGAYSSVRAVSMLDRIIDAQRLGKKASLIGSSLSQENIHEDVKQRLEVIGQTNVFLRDPLSARRLKKGANIKGSVVADSAFLLEPRLCKEGKRISKKVESKECDFIGINTNWRLFKQEVTRQEYLSALENMVMAMNKKYSNICFLTLPHDRRGGSESDFSVSEELADKLNKYGVNVICPKTNIRSHSIKKICEMIDFVITSRMHVAIASLGSECPVASVAYKGKFKGLYEHFGLSGCVANQDVLFDKSKLSEFVAKVFEEKEKHKNKIKSELPKVTEMAKDNFAFINRV